MTKKILAGEKCADLMPSVKMLCKHAGLLTRLSNILFPFPILPQFFDPPKSNKIRKILTVVNLFLMGLPSSSSPRSFFICAFKIVFWDIQ